MLTESPTPMPVFRPPRLLHLWGRLTRGVTLGVRAAVIDAQGHILLVRHTYVAGWHLPGGGVDAGETAEEAIRRELVEEAAIRLTAPPRLHGLFLNTHLGSRDHVAVFVAGAFIAEAPCQPNREIAEAGFFPSHALPAATTPATRRRVVEIVEGLPPAAYW
ncbi:ADP-ribose pyrophosphatase YjhB (NUDIX family) [Ancylobacter sp. 3268]|uniref:NUDIX domain-containing protein n=1 Tax=Ancylobacter sp. 3268 TaxID=2817752 RepID=UPI0028644550|nr:NUDIX domain-containing protein [Ancylobacter sp. 3268]MDR6951680.1 ADP-ribose pyrophosphatase YjhB (NUDIX family) [Ancylobacter sp. 3268]